MCQSLYDDVVQFYDRMKFRRPAVPMSIDVQRRAQLIAYILSELAEFGDSVALKDQVDATTDLLYFVMDMFVEMGVDPAVPFAIVHKSNMQKLWPDGHPRFDQSVVPPRLIKPDGWQPPEKEIEKYLKTFDREDD